MLTYYKSINKSLISAMLIAMTLFFSACSEDSGGTYPPQPAPAFTISGTVLDESNVSILDAQVTIVNFETQQNALDPFYTIADGKYSFDLPAGTYEVRIQAQGYIASPPDRVIGIPISTTTVNNVNLVEITDVVTRGQLSLQLQGYTNTVGALVVLTNGPDNYSAVTSVSGELMMYNLPALDYNLTIKTIGHTTLPVETLTILDLNINLTEVTKTLTENPGSTVASNVQFKSSANRIAVDVSLTDKITGKVIPGTTVYTVSTEYSIASVAAGDYFIRATYNIDQNVVDPNEIADKGEPKVSVVEGVDVEPLPIVLTGAVHLKSPITPSNSAPVEVASLTPTFEWTAYPSADDHVIEVVDQSGVVVWGGFEDNGSKKFIIDSSIESITYGTVGTAVPLIEDSYYRWKLYASKEDGTQLLGWKFISSSEEAQGIFKVVAP